MMSSRHEMLLLQKPKDQDWFERYLSVREEEKDVMSRRQINALIVLFTLNLGLLLGWLLYRLAWALMLAEWRG